MSKKKNHTPLGLRLIPFIFPKLEAVSPSLAERFFIYLFFTPFKYKIPEKEIEAERTAEKFIVEADRKKIQCYSWGSGPAVLMIHGWAGRGTQFRKFIEPLNQAGFRAVAMDGPAHGKSDGKNTNLDEFNSAIQAVALKAGNVKAIIAHSFGGAASLYSITQGLPVSTLINIASPTIGDKIIETYLRAIGASWKTGDRFKAYVIKKSGRTFDSYTSLHFIKQLTSPLNLLLVHDEGDKEVSIEHPYALRKEFPQAELIETTGLGHTRILKDEDLIQQIVTYIQSRTSGV